MRFERGNYYLCECKTGGCFIGRYEYKGKIKVNKTQRKFTAFVFNKVYMINKRNNCFFFDYMSIGVFKIKRFKQLTQRQKQKATKDFNTFKQLSSLFTIN